MSEGGHHSLASALSALAEALEHGDAVAGEGLMERALELVRAGAPVDASSVEAAARGERLAVALHRQLHDELVASASSARAGKAYQGG